LRYLGRKKMSGGGSSSCHGGVGKKEGREEKWEKLNSERDKRGETSRRWGNRGEAEKERGRRNRGKGEEWGRGGSVEEGGRRGEGRRVEKGTREKRERVEGCEGVREGREGGGKEK